jgi:glucose-6-phosphate 1-epimerase
MYSIKSFENGFEYIEVQNESAWAKIALQGAHIFEFITNRGSLLWLSEISVFERGIAIRGGIPLCWPRFGSLDSSLPQHGFARTEMFELIEVIEKDAATTEITMRLSDSHATRRLWDYQFVLEVKITLTQELKIELITTNKESKDMMLTQALHTYFKISDISNITIKGLEQKIYLDTLTNDSLYESESITIDKEIDRVYQGVDENIELVDNNKKVTLATTGSSSAIVWNPWIEKCSKMSYMNKNAYKEFVCIESANAFDDFKTVKSQKSHTLSLIASF